MTNFLGLLCVKKMRSSWLALHFAIINYYENSVALLPSACEELKAGTIQRFRTGTFQVIVVSVSIGQDFEKTIFLLFGGLHI